MIRELLTRETRIRMMWVGSVFALGSVLVNGCRFGFESRIQDSPGAAGMGGNQTIDPGEGGKGGEINTAGAGGEGGSPVTEICGNGIVENNEACDTGPRNGLFYGDASGCSRFCTREPNCRDVDTDGCVSVCGDGMRVSPEECDDGNARNGDGCSSHCVIERGFTCTHELLNDGQPCSADSTKQCLTMPIVYRDFVALGFPGGHEDMLLRGRARKPENGGQMIDSSWVGLCTDMIASTLNDDGKPQLRADYAGCAELGGIPVITSAETYLDWYSNDHPSDATYLSSLELSQAADVGTYQFSSDAHFPLDGLTQADELQYCAENDYLLREPLGPDPCVATHNYHFTSEVRYVFRYNGGEVLDFSGDDDVWVFVNGRKALDLGGVHNAAAGTVMFDAQDLTIGRIYEILVFHADRHPVESRYQLSLTGFEVERTTSCTRN